jgi:hypothetical protein
MSACAVLNLSAWMLGLGMLWLHLAESSLAQSLRYLGAMLIVFTLATTLAYAEDDLILPNQNACVTMCGLLEPYGVWWFWWDCQCCVNHVGC